MENVKNRIQAINENIVQLELDKVPLDLELKQDEQDPIN